MHLDRCRGLQHFIRYYHHLHRFSVGSARAVARLDRPRCAVDQIATTPIVTVTADHDVCQLTGPAPSGRPIVGAR